MGWVLEEQDVDILAWAMGTAEVPRGAGGARHDDPAQGPRTTYRNHRALTTSRKSPCRPTAVHPGRRARGFLSWLAADLARGGENARVSWRPTSGDAGTGDAAPVTRRSTRPDLPGLGLPALRRLAACSTFETRTTLRAAAQYGTGAAFGHHGQCGAAATLTPSDPPARRAARARRADRPRAASRFALGQWLARTETVGDPGEFAVRVAR